MRIDAEEVETRKQLPFLLSKGCQVMQTYCFLSRTIPTRKFR